MVEENSIEIWKYQMYFLVMEFQCKSRLSPPFSLFEHIYILIQFLFKRICLKKKKRGKSTLLDWHPRRQNVAAQVAEELKTVTYATPSYGRTQKEKTPCITPK